MKPGPERNEVGVAAAVDPAAARDGRRDCREMKHRGTEDTEKRTQETIEAYAGGYRERRKSWRR
jgi:hypothetical protein